MRFLCMIETMNAVPEPFAPSALSNGYMEHGFPVSSLPADGMLGRLKRDVAQSEHRRSEYMRSYANSAAGSEELPP